MLNLFDNQYFIGKIDSKAYRYLSLRPRFRTGINVSGRRAGMFGQFEVGKRL